MNARRTDFLRWITWSAVGAAAFLALNAVADRLPRVLIAFLLVVNCPWILYAPPAGRPAFLVVGYVYFLAVSAILLLPLFFHEKRWKLVAGGVALVLLISGLMINLLLLARWAG